MNISEIKKSIAAGELDERFSRVYGSASSAQKERYTGLLNDFESIFGGAEVRFFSAPGRTEVSGNHTDHNHGQVLAAAINLDVIAAVQKTDDDVISVKSRGFDKMDVVSLTNLMPVEDERTHSAALIRGIAARFSQLGYNIGGFKAATTSDVLSGSGLSSSAAFEVLIGTILNYLYNDGKISPVEIAQIAQYSENVFFGKPCGLMDQMACSVGGFVHIDFENPAKPVIKPIDFDLAKYGYTLCITDTKADHADLTDEYAAIRCEMEQVAGVLNQKCLRDTSEEEFMAKLAEIRKKTSDRAILRAMHFYAENKRVEKAAKALANEDIESFKSVILASGASSYQYNQNVNSVKMKQFQPVGLALSLSQLVLEDKGAWRVHGGGFAGTIQAFVPNAVLDEYISTLEAVFGKNSVYVLNIRAVGGTEI